MFAMPPDAQTVGVGMSIIHTVQDAIIQYYLHILFRCG